MKDTKELENKSLTVLDQAKAISITSIISYENAAKFLRTIKGLKAEIEETFGPIIQKAHQAHKEACAQKKKYEAPLEDAENIIKTEMIRWGEEMEFARKEQEAKLNSRQDGIKSPIVVRSQVTKMDGISTKIHWTFKIVDESAIPREYLKPDETKIRGVVAALKSATNIPGIIAIEEKIMAVS